MDGDTAAAHPAPARRRVLFAALAGLVVALLVPAPARAHAAPLATTPATGTVIGASPATVTVTFSEPVAVVPGRAQVLAPDGERISGEATVAGAVLTIPVRRAQRPLGTYLVSYRIISADSHPVGGGFTFSVGAPSAPPEAAEADRVHPSVAVALPAVRYLGYAGLTLAAGPALFLALLWPRRLSRAGGVRLVRAGLALVAFSAVAGAWLQAPYTSGLPAWRASPGALAAALNSPFGLAMALRLAAVGAVAALLGPVLRGTAGRARGLAVTAVAVAGLVSWPLSGHAAASPLPPVSIAADVVHIAAMAVWLGGLVVLVGVLLRRADPRALGVILPAWSRWAQLAVVWLVGGGLVQAVIEVGAPGNLVGTGYGRLLLAKTALLVGVLAAAAYARRLVARRAVVTTGPRRIRRAVGAEVAATTVVLALSSVLVQATPGRVDAAEAAAAAGAGTSGTLTSALYTLQFDIYPVQLGENNTVHAFVYTADGTPLPAEEWQITTALPALGVEPVKTPMLGVRPHHAMGAVTFPVAGEWEVRFTVRTSPVDQATVATRVTVR
ncbi:copper resistance CopC/CopD family protein [Spirilliplanes yamanashiensis]|uniref:copper resistance CopC/CopD family protein n=1 Tax=Spirilliplanes yamanashiensis TaxID=42233 RepID=UPI001EF3A364|nr:copper resistance protein CopC [Spirilliplanes yamanashiensis]MDP9817672.1 copper transport protein [Spirilliplanes yamanashiensis]